MSLLMILRWVLASTKSRKVHIRGGVSILKVCLTAKDRPYA